MQLAPTGAWPGLLWAEEDNEGSSGFSGSRVSGLCLDGFACRILSSQLRNQVSLVAGLGCFL